MNLNQISALVSPQATPYPPIAPATISENSLASAEPRCHSVDVLALRRSSVSCSRAALVLGAPWSSRTGVLASAGWTSSAETGAALLSAWIHLLTIARVSSAVANGAVGGLGSGGFSGATERSLETRFVLLGLGVFSLTTKSVCGSGGG